MAGAAVGKGTAVAEEVAAAAGVRGGGVRAGGARGEAVVEGVALAVEATAAVEMAVVAEV